MPITRLIALFLATLATSWLSAESVRNPTKRVGAGPLFQIHRGNHSGYMDRTGEVVIEPRFDDERDFFRGLAGVRVGKKWGFIDVRGKLVIGARFDDVRDFLDELAPVRIGRKWGYIDTSGRMAVQPQFQAAGEFHEGLARVHVWDKVSCFSGKYTSETAPEQAFLLQEDDPSDYPSCFAEGGRFGFIDTSGRLVIEPRFFEAQDFSEGLAAVRLEIVSRKYGYIDRSGSWAIEPAFNQADRFSEGLAAVETSAQVVWHHVINTAYGFIDHTGRLAIPAKYQLAGEFSGGLAPVAVRLGWFGYVDRDGKMVIAPQFREAWNFSEGLAVACGDECVYINRSGDPVIRRSGIWWPFSDGLAVLDTNGGQTYIDKRGRDVAPYRVE